MKNKKLIVFFVIGIICLIVVLPNYRKYIPYNEYCSLAERDKVKEIMQANQDYHVYIFAASMNRIEFSNNQRTLSDFRDFAIKIKNKMNYKLVTNRMTYNFKNEQMSESFKEYDSQLIDVWDRTKENIVSIMNMSYDSDFINLRDTSGAANIGSTLLEEKMSSFIGKAGYKMVNGKPVDINQ